MDRGYQDFRTFYRMQQHHAFYVARAKRNVRFRVCRARPVDRQTGLRCDQDVRLTGGAAPLYPERLRRVRYHDAEHGHSLVFWTNQFDLPALTIADLYRQRWQVELFFKWIKSNLRICHFLGLSDNAVRIQLWSAICVYALVAIAKKRSRLPHSLHQILQVCSVATLMRVLPIIGEPTAEEDVPKLTRDKMAGAATRAHDGHIRVEETRTSLLEELVARYWGSGTPPGWHRLRRSLERLQLLLAEASAGEDHASRNRGGVRATGHRHHVSLQTELVRAWKTLSDA